MQNKFTVKNFRVFNEDGATFDFKPITLLTGCNSSGKSSLTKSIMLLQDFFKQGFKDQNDRRKKVFEPSKYWLDFSKAELKLGGFGSEINRDSKGEEIGFSYSCVPSVAPLFEFHVDYWFSAKKNDDLKRGWLSRIVIRTEDEVIMKASVNKEGSLMIDYLNLNLTETLGSFQRFFILVNIIYLKKKDTLCYDPYGDLIDEEQHNRIQKRISELTDSADKHIKDGVTQREVECARRLVSSLSAEGVKEPAELYPHLFDADLLKAWETCREKYILFYFPLFDSFEKLDKTQSCELLKKASFFFGSSKDSMIDKVIGDYRDSEYESFVDYFRAKEDEKLGDVIVHHPFHIELSDNDLIHRIDHEMSVSFDGNGLIWGGEKNNVDFNKLYRFLSDWQWSLTPQRKDEYISRWVQSNDFFDSTHMLYSAFKEYLGILIQEIVLPQFFAEIHYIGNSHMGIKRLYSFDDKGDDQVDRIVCYLDARRDYEVIKGNKVMGFDEERFVPGSFINKWIRELELGHSLCFEIDEDSLGAKMILKKSSNDKGISLADEGYGVNQIVSLLICIETEILLLMAELIRNTEIPVIGQPEPETYVLNPVTVIIEEPEVNLHPAFQSKLVDVFLDAFSMFGGGKIQFIIETHSEYIVRATQVYVAKQKYEDDEMLQEKNPFKVYYIPKDGIPYDMEYTRTGRFVRKFGEGFFDAASSLNLELMKLERE